MRLGMIGLGRMGANMTRRLLAAGHDVVVHDLSTDAVRALAAEGAVPAPALPDLVAALPTPRHVWLMVPAAVVDGTIDRLAPLLSPGDVIVDGGNSYYRDDLHRAERLAAAGLHYVDCGVSGGVWGRERGYCLMIGGEPHIVAGLVDVFESLAPGEGAVPPSGHREGRDSTAHRGYLHCGPAGAGHFVKMVHNGIEYGLMAAYAEGLNILHHANVGATEHRADAETAPLSDASAYRYEFDLADITELWRRGSVVSSWLLDLTAAALARSPRLEEYSGTVSDSGEGRWTVLAAVEEGVPAHVLTAALYSRFDSRGRSEFANRTLSAMRHAFGGHLEPKRGR